MMDTPFFINPWNVRGIPAQRKTTASPKVISIPVHFVGSEKTRSDSALKIQKAFRGFLVRKSAKEIAELRREVDAMERSILTPETVDSIKRDPKKRLRVNESLMSLLFKLDSVRGVDSAVRDCRKSVIRKVIALQETVDEIAAGDQTLGEKNSDSLVEAVEQNFEIKDSVECCENNAGDDETLESRDGVESETPKPCNASENHEKIEELSVPEEVIEDFDASESDDSSEPSVNAEDEKEEDGVEIAKPDRDERNRELIERMISDNEKLMGLMTELFEKNEMQTRLLSSLSQRVESLERALLCERLRRKKKRNAGGAVDCETTMITDSKKCGKR